VVVHVGVQHGRQHQVLRVLGHSRFGGQQRNRGSRAQVRNPRSNRPVRHHSHTVRVCQVESGSRPWPEPSLAGEIGAGVELNPGGSVQLGRLSLLHGGRHQEATGQDRYIQRD